MFDGIRHGIIRLLEDAPKAPESRGLAAANEGLLDILKAGNGRGGTPNLLYKLLGVYQTVTVERRQFRDQVRQLEFYYLTDVIFNTVACDALTPDVTTNEVVSFDSPNPAVKEELNNLRQRFNLDSIVSNIAVPMLKDGDYILRLEVQPGQGIVNIHDDVDALNVIVSYDQEFPEAFFQLNKQGQIEQKPPSNYAHFLYRPRKLSMTKPYTAQSFEISLTNATDEKDLTRYVRIGTPLLQNIMTKIKDLILLELLIPAIPINNLAHGGIIGVQVPSTTNPSDALSIAQRYEDIFNKQIGISQDSQLLTAADVIGVAGRYRVLPIYADKGGLQTIDVKNDSTLQIVLGAVDQMRSLILTSVGIPPSVIFGGTLTESDALRLYSRYTRTLKSVQQAIDHGLTQICLAHLNNVGVEAAPNDIKVVFRNQLINLDEIQALEFQTQLIQSFELLQQFIFQGNDPTFGGSFDPASAMKWIGQRMNAFFSARVD